MLKILFLIALAFPAYADELYLKDPRYCGEPERDYNGRIKRSKAVTDEFMSMYPLPEGADRNVYQLNHTIPLVCGGCDSVVNLMWMHVKAKTCAGDYCQDRIEQYVMCPRSFKR